MPVDPVQAVIHALGHESHKQHKQGNHGKATGLSLIAFGIFLLPIPIIGIPMIGMGLEAVLVRNLAAWSHPV